VIRDENTRARALSDHLLPQVNRELESAATLEGRLQRGVLLWNETLFTDRYTLEVERGAVVGIEQPEVTLSSTDLLAHARGYKRFLEKLARFNTVGKLRNLRLGLSEIQASLADRQAAARIVELLDLVAQLQPVAAYLMEAQANLPASDAWSVHAHAVRHAVINDLRHEYVSVYADIHRKLRLGPAEDEVRQRLYRDPRYLALKTLAAIDLLPRGELDTWFTTITDLVACPEFYEGVIADVPTCPHCHLRPAQEHQPAAHAQTLDELDRQLDELLRRWRQALRDALSSESACTSRAALLPDERAPIETFLAQPNDAVEVPAGLVAVATQALRGIRALAIPAPELVAALKNGGMPCTVEALKQRFTQFIQAQMQGYDKHNTRLTLE